MTPSSEDLAPANAVRHLTELTAAAGHALQVQRAPCVVGDLVAEALGELQGLADRAGLELVGDPVPMVVWGDANRLVQALGTLVSNAIEVSPRGGRVVVLAEQRPGEVRLAVVDQGRGAAGPVPAICTRIALAHGGRIWVESAPGRGTAVVLSLPVRRRPR